MVFDETKGFARSVNDNVKVALLFTSRCLCITHFYNLYLSFRVSVEIARGTPHGRDREKWGGSSSGGRDRRDGDRRGGSGRSGGGGGGRDGRDRPVWLDKYGPPTRTDYRVVVENLSSRVSWQVTSFYLTFFLLRCA